MTDRLALTIPEAAKAVGCGESTLREAISKHYLVVRYIGPRKPVVEIDELRRWLASLPTEADRQRI